MWVQRLRLPYSLVVALTVAASSLPEAGAEAPEELRAKLELTPRAQPLLSRLQACARAHEDVDFVSSECLPPVVSVVGVRQSKVAWLRRSEPVDPGCGDFVPTRAVVGSSRRLWAKGTEVTTDDSPIDAQLEALWRFIGELSDRRFSPAVDLIAGVARVDTPEGGLATPLVALGGPLRDYLLYVEPGGLGYVYLQHARKGARFALGLSNFPGGLADIRQVVFVPRAWRLLIVVGRPAAECEPHPVRVLGYELPRGLRLVDDWSVGFDDSEQRCRRGEDAGCRDACEDGWAAGCRLAAEKLGGESQFRLLQYACKLGDKPACEAFRRMGLEGKLGPLPSFWRPDFFAPTVDKKGDPEDTGPPILRAPRDLPPLPGPRTKPPGKGKGR